MVWKRTKFAQVALLVAFWFFFPAFSLLQRTCCKSKLLKLLPMHATKRVVPQGKPRLQEFNNPNRLKIIGGSAKGRKIDSPDIYLRPMMAKVREAVFSSLTSFGLFDSPSTRVLDIFAGAGSVGLEALSRGAAHATFVDFSSACTKTIAQNAIKCEFTEPGQVQTVCAKAEEVLADPVRFGLTEPYHIVALTPPYLEVSYPDLLDLLTTSPLLTSDTFLLIEYPVEMGTLPQTLGKEGQSPELVGLRNRRYGRTQIVTYVKRPTQAYDLHTHEFIPSNTHVKRANAEIRKVPKAPQPS